MRALRLSAGALIASFLLCGSAFAGDEWIVRKTSGEVWTGQAAQPVSLSRDAVLKPGDTVTTGRNGRVLLVRGEETILVSPNSIIGIPAEKKDGLATTITQQAGSILLEVEKKNVPHFEVETPYLAAVVKGTQFRVSVTETGARVDVTRGKVEVADFRSGDVAQVLPGQAAETHAGSNGLHMTGSGDFLPIQHGTPRNSTITPIMVPKGGLNVPTGLDRNRTRDALRTQPATKDQNLAVTHRASVIRISAPLGEMRLNVQKVTHGLARDIGKAGDTGRHVARRDATVWSADNGGASLVSTNVSSNGSNSAAGGGNGGGGGGNSGGNGGSSGGSGGGASGAGGAGATPAAAVAPGSKGQGNVNGNGNSQSASNGNGNGHNGNGNNEHGNNGNGNGNGNGGVGNGNGKGNGKH